MRVDIIEDDPTFIRMIEHIVRQYNIHDVRTHQDGRSFLSKLSSSTEIVTLDLGLPDISGKELMHQIKAFNEEIEIVIISGQDDISLAVQLLKEGAHDYITKDENIRERLHHTLKKLEINNALKQEVAQLKNKISDRYAFRETILGNSGAIKSIFTLIEKAIKVPSMPVSLYGETGTGKELTAKTIHHNSPRKSHPFITLSLSAIPREQIYSSLFGFEKDAFPGALMTTKGKIEEAGHGTLFLDEVTYLDSDLQLSILEALQKRKAKRIGGDEEIPINCRVISATTHDLSKAVSDQEFREDLYYYLMGLPISMPALRERGKDIILLADYFLNAFCRDNDLQEISISSGAKRKLLSYPFPGNIRELKAIVELGAVLTNDGTITEKHVVFNNSQQSPEVLSEELTLKEYNERIILYFLKKYNNVIEVAEKLDIGKSTIYNLLKKQKEDI